MKRAEKQNTFYAREAYIIKFEHDHILKTELKMNIGSLFCVDIGHNINFFKVVILF